MLKAVGNGRAGGGGLVGTVHGLKAEGLEIERFEPGGIDAGLGVDQLQLLP